MNATLTQPTVRLGVAQALSSAKRSFDERVRRDERRFVAEVNFIRAQFGLSWAQIGKVYGLTESAAEARFNRD